MIQICRATAMGLKARSAGAFAALILLLAFSSSALAQDSSSSSPALKYCYGPYALCTVARCSVPADRSPVGSNVECRCTVEAGYSVGKACKADPDPRSVLSRYSPIFAYQECPGVIDGKQAVWADCVNARCRIDRNNPGAATCECPTATSTTPFIIASDHPDKAGCRGCTLDSDGHYECPGGVISSATTTDGQQITVLIQDAIGNIKVFPAPSK
jgi:hypothetical protein